MKIAEIRKKNDNDLQKMIAERRESVRSLRFKVASKEVKNHQLLRGAKRDIARILTVLRQRQDGHGNN